MNQTSEVVIVGAGAAGCAVAYYLAQAGVKATVIEERGTGSQASGFAAGGLNPLQGAGIPGPLAPLALESYRMHLDLWGRLKEETGIDLQGRIVSLLKVAFQESELPEFQETLELFNAAAGFQARWLDAPEIAKLEPRVAPDAIRGLYARGNAAVDSYKYTLALAQAAERLGTTFRSGAVRGLARSNGRVTGLHLEGGTVSCGQVVLAMGPWSRKAEAWLDTYIPVDPLKGEILRVELPGPPLSYELSGGGASLYPKPDGMVWCGGTEEWHGFDREPSESARQCISRGAARLIPDLARSRLVLQTACLRPVTPDWLPIIGRAPGWENVYLATGAGKKGILISPGMGKAVADLVTRGTTELPINPFSPHRFAGPLD